MWVKKYRPSSLQEYRGASSQKKELKEWLENWEKGDKPVLLHGQAGTGKTSLAEILAKEMDYEMVETNASDVRTKKKLKKELKEATRQASFFGGKKLILIDEVDGMSSTDRGGVKELGTILDESRFPVIMTANDAYDSKIKSLRNRAKMVELGSVHTNSINAHLKNILDEEGIEYDDSAVKRLARQSGGQMRSAINDLEAIAKGKDKLVKEDLDVLGYRDSEQEIFDSLKMIFKTDNIETARNATQNLEEDADTFLQWIRENVPREYKKKDDLARAYRNISKADLFNGRIRIRMNWKLLKYVYHFSSVGVALSKEEKYEGWTKYQYPSKIRRMGSSRASRNTRDSITEKLSEKLHISQKDSRMMIPFISKLVENKSEIGEQLELNEKESEYLKKAS